MSLMTPQEFDGLLAYVNDRYERSGQKPDVIRALKEHNYRVLGHVEEICDGENLDEADRELLKTIAVLHDVAKADTHLMLHAHVGGEIAGEKLRELGKDERFIETVQNAIECHLGPFPFIDEEAVKYEQRTGEHLHLPRPRSRIEQLFYDADMLALIDIEGIEKVRVLRETTPEFITEDEEEARTNGGTPRGAAYRSALQSVRRAADTLHSNAARRIAERLVAEAQAYVDDHLQKEQAAS